MEGPLTELHAFLASRNFHIQPVFNGKILRFDRGGRTHNAWGMFNEFKLNSQTFYSAKIGDWATGEVYAWDSSEKLSPEELTQAKKFLKEADKLYEEEKERLQNEAATLCENIWNRGIDRGTTAYLDRKGLRKLYGARIDADRPGNILVPLRDIQGKLWNIQKIFPEKYGQANIDKCFTEGAKIKGCFHTIGEFFPKGRVLICEGFATGASIHESTGHTTVVAFNAGNLLAVCKSIRECYPEIQITVCGDNDQWTKKQDGTLWNVGKEKASFAAGAVGANKVLPKFKALQTKPTDFNDLANLEGLEAVKEQILNPPITKELDTIVELTAQGKPKLPSEHKLVKTLIDYFEGELLTQENDLFKWVGTHWQYQDKKEVKLYKNLLQKISGNMLKTRDIESAYKQFLLQVPEAPKNLFQPNPYAVNFLNGTLIISKLPDQNRFVSKFHEHSQSDYITNVIPLRYEPEKRATNIEFAKMVDRIFENDPDKMDKIQALKELFGSCLTPAFPRIFLLVGPPGSGKSTIAIIASKLVSQDNLSMVEPHEFSGFHMESMLGKLVNISTDIRTNEGIDDAMMKKIEDRVPVRIDRKFNSAVMAWLPAVHIFGCNKLPPNYEGDSRAFTRRTTVLEFKSFKAIGHFNRNFANEVFETCPEGFLNFALEGLQSLLDNGGHFTNPGSGTKRLESWQMHYDAIGQFFKDLMEGQIEGQSKIDAGAEYKIERKLLWKNFVEWHTDSFGRIPRISKHKFYEEVETRFCTLIVDGGTRYFKGVKITESNSGKF